MSETISARFCPHCLAPIRAEDHVCPACGQSVVEAQESVPAFAGGDMQATSVPQPTHQPGAYDPRLSVRLTPAQGPQGPVRSRKLLIAVIVLAILPPVLPIPFYGLAQLLIGHLTTTTEQWGRCGFATPSATYRDCLTYWGHMSDLLGLGPSSLVAVASVFLGTIGLVRTRWHPTSPKNMTLFRASVTWGVVWMLLGSCILCVLFFVDTIHD